MAGRIALIQRGTCNFGVKVQNAQAAGASGVIIFNEGNPGRTAVLSGNLSDAAGNPIIPTIPVAFTSFDTGLHLYNEYQQAVQNNTALPVMNLAIKAIVKPNTDDYNVIADSKGGDPNHVVVVDAHLDAIYGAGMLDNASGSATILDIAQMMRKVQPRNKLRFIWFGGEELGLLGSKAYINSLSPSELSKIGYDLDADVAARTMGACMTVSFHLSPEQEQLKLGARQFAEEHLRPLAAEVRKEPDPLRRALLARPAFEKAVAAGFLKGLIPAPFGGVAAGGVEACILIEEWACHSPDFVISLAGPLIALAPVYEAGTPEQIQRFVAPFLVDHGAPVAAMAFSEPEGTANFAAPPPAQGLRTTAVPDGDWWVVNGRKAWASHLAGWDGNGPDVMTIVCRTPGGVSLIVAEREHLAGHIEVEEHYDLAGLRGCMTSRIRLRDVRVPRSNILGAEGHGVQLTYNAFWASGASIGIFAVAAMRQAFDVAYHYALTEKRGGAVPIIEHQSVADVLADAKSRIEAVRLLAWRALDAVIAQDPAGPELALHAKIFGSEMGVEVISRLMNVIGVQAYDNNFPLMAYLSEALAYPVIEGSNTGIRRRQLQDLFRTPGYNPLSASGMA